jgi:hypothetical protein
VGKEASGGRGGANFSYTVMGLKTFGVKLVDKELNFQYRLFRTLSSHNIGLR